MRGGRLRRRSLRKQLLSVPKFNLLKGVDGRRPLLCMAPSKAATLLHLVV